MATKDDENSQRERIERSIMDRNKAPDALLAVAEAAQDVAAGLHKFLSPVSDSGVEITALISKCFAVSSSLRSLAVAVQDSRRLSLFNRVSGEVEDVAKSLDHTFKDLHQIVGEGFEDARKARLPMSAAYRKVWRNINDHFQRESGNQLVRRLDYCRLLLNDLCDILQDGYFPLRLRSPRQRAIWCSACLNLPDCLQIPT